MPEILIEQSSMLHLPILIANDPEEELLSISKIMILEQFKRYGIILFRSFKIGIERFQSLVKFYSKSQIPYPGSQRLPVSVDGKVQTVDAGMKAIALHSELSHTPFRPDICWFYCVKAPKIGSETTLCDGALLAANLPKQHLKLFEGETLLYRRTTSITFLEKLLGTRDRGELSEFLSANPKGKCYIIRGNKVDQDFEVPVLQSAKFLNQLVFVNNIIHNYRPGKPLLYPTLSKGHPIPNTTILDICKIAKNYTFNIHWHDEDLLMIDNTRFMHGRQSILDPERTIWTQFSDFDL
jgi:hypothetical protein